MSLVRSNDYNGYTVGIALTFQAIHLPLKPHCLIHEKIKDLNRTQQTSILSSWLRMDACFFTALFVDTPCPPVAPHCHRLDDRSNQ